MLAMELILPITGSKIDFGVVRAFVVTMELPFAIRGSKYDVSVVFIMCQYVY